jgi:hypothetical protein
MPSTTALIRASSFAFALTIAAACGESPTGPRIPPGLSGTILFRDGSALRLLDVASGSTRLLMSDVSTEAHRVQPLPAGDLLVFVDHYGASAYGERVVAWTELRRVSLDRTLSEGVASPCPSSVLYFVAVAADGRMACIANLGTMPESSAIYVDGHALLRGSVMGPAPAWSADGRSILACATRSSGDGLYRFGVADSSESLLLAKPFPLWRTCQFKYSPSDGRIAFGHDEDDPSAGSQVWVAGAEGTDPHAVSTGPTDYLSDYATEGGWSPDGASVLFERVSPDGWHQEVWVAAADGSGA